MRFLNRRFADDDFNRIDVNEVRRLAATCSTGCDIDAFGEVGEIEGHNGFVSGLAQLAADAAPARARAARQPLATTRVPAGLWFGNEDSVVGDRETPWPLTPKE